MSSYLSFSGSILWGNRVTDKETFILKKKSNYKLNQVASCFAALLTAMYFNPAVKLNSDAEQTISCQILDFKT